jgi:ribonuclease P protein component
MTCVRSAESGPPRVAYAVPRSVGNAVVRNRVRRRLRSLVQSHASQLREGHAYLIGAAASAANTTYPELEGALGALLDVTEPSR